MANSLAELKKSSKTSRIEQLNKEVEKLKTRGYDNTDERFWLPTPDPKTGSGSAVIRFLDAPKGEDVPFIRMFTHSKEFKHGWYINKSPSTIGKECPVYDEFKSLWKEDPERAKKESPTRRTEFISNILVISDPKNPDAEGKVFLFRYGKKINEKYMDLLQPEDESEDAVDPFNFWTGRNFKLKFKNKDGFRNYDASAFESNETPVAESEEEISKIWNACYSLAEFHNEENFKSYDELKKELHRAMGIEDSSNVRKVSNNTKLVTEDEAENTEDHDDEDNAELIRRMKALCQDDDIPF